MNTMWFPLIDLMYLPAMSIAPSPITKRTLFSMKLVSSRRSLATSCSFLLPMPLATFLSAFTTLAGSPLLRPSLMIAASFCSVISALLLSVILALDNLVRRAPSIASMVLRACAVVSSSPVKSAKSDWNSSTADLLLIPKPSGLVVNRVAIRASLRSIPLNRSPDSRVLTKSLIELRTRPLLDTTHDERKPNKSFGLRLRVISCIWRDPSKTLLETKSSTVTLSFWSELIASIALSMEATIIAATSSGAATSPSGLRPKLSMKSLCFLAISVMSPSSTGSVAFASALCRLSM